MRTVMKIHFLLIASILALLIGGCASDSSMTDEEHSAASSRPAPGSPDPMSHMATPPGEYPLSGGSPRY